MEFFGRLHPLLLHLPIGILILAFLMEWTARRTNKDHYQTAIAFALKLGMWTAILSAISGYLLSEGGDYDENSLFWHQWLGIATALFSIILYVLHQRKESNPSFQKIYFPTFSSTILLLLITGHLGGSLTHGSDFLTEPFQEKEDPTIADLNNANVFESFIQPIFKQKCNSCHNESKLKGKLLLSSIEGIQKGGKTGALFVAGDPKKSLLMERIHLPVEEKKHMPPKGKKQLEDSEIQLLEWWLKEGGDFEKTVIQSNPPEAIQSILNKYAEPADEGVFALDISPASESRIQELWEVGFQAYPVAQESPFLDVAWKGDSLTKAILKKLKRVSNQVIRLNLGKSNLNDALFSIIADLPHLQKLSANQTAISGAALKHLSDHEYLEYLNLHHTQVDNKGVQNIFQLKRLKKLFLWETLVSPELVAEISKERPKLEVNMGINTDIFGDARLNPPIVIADKIIFRDSATVELKSSFKSASIHYTLDGTDPDSSSAIYDGEILLTQTTELRAINWKEGWETSDAVIQLFVHSEHQPKSIHLDKQPNEKYAANGAQSLIDYKKGSDVFTDGNWLGYQGSHFTATLDLGETTEVSRVTVSALASPSSWIFFPKGMEVSISMDGNNYKKVKSKNYQTTTETSETELKSFSEGFQEIEARYVKVQVKSNLKNPSWHPNAGEPCWVFVDEILIE